jgi:hypothetical protein
MNKIDTQMNKIHLGCADPEDLPILVAALREDCPWLVSFNLRHYRPGVPAITVLRPGDFCPPGA